MGGWGITGPLGTETRQVDVFGYMNCLKDFDAAVQWAIFMSSVVEQQQNGFTVESFEYRKMPAVRFIGKELRENGADSARERSALFRVLDEMSENRSGFDYNLLFEHHYGKGVDVEPCHGFWGRFMKAGTPVPDGFLYFDLIPSQGLQETEPGPPFFSQFAFAVFTGDQEAMHRRQGFDSSAMYDITRNIILGQGVGIPYPDKYWTAEVFLNGFDRSNSAYLFCAEL